MEKCALERGGKAKRSRPEIIRSFSLGLPGLLDKQTPNGPGDWSRI